MMITQFPAQGARSAQLCAYTLLSCGAQKASVGRRVRVEKPLGLAGLRGWRKEPGSYSGRWDHWREEPDLWARTLGSLDVEEEAEAAELAGWALRVPRPLPPFSPQDGTPTHTLPPFLGDGPALSPALLSEFLARGPCPLFGEVAASLVPMSSPGRKPASPLQRRQKKRWPCARLISAPALEPPGAEVGGGWPQVLALLSPER